MLKSKNSAAIIKAVSFTAFFSACPAYGANGRISLWSTIEAGGIIGYVIILTSLVVVALVVENFLTIRRKRLVPYDLAEQIQNYLDAGEYEQAEKLCEDNASFLSDVISAGLAAKESMLGYFDMQTAMRESAERSISALYRKLEYLAFIGSVAPILGLLGTVTGMITAFNQIALTEGTARPSELAGGISEALITTCLGLIVAIPAMFFTTFFRNRINRYISEAEVVVEKIMKVFRNQQN